MIFFILHTKIIRVSICGCCNVNNLELLIVKTRKQCRWRLSCPQDKGSALIYEEGLFEPRKLFRLCLFYGSLFILCGMFTYGVSLTTFINYNEEFLFPVFEAYDFTTHKKKCTYVFINDIIGKKTYSFTKQLLLVIIQNTRLLLNLSFESILILLLSISRNIKHA